MLALVTAETVVFGVTLRATVLLPEQPPVEPVTVYVVFTTGFTEIVEVVGPVFHV
jgi:hypothetical protein